MYIFPVGLVYLYIIQINIFVNLMSLQIQFCIWDYEYVELHCLLVIFVDEADDDFDHGVFFFSAAFGDHEGEGDKGVDGDALGIISKRTVLKIESMR